MCEYVSVCFVCVCVCVCCVCVCVCVCYAYAYVVMSFKHLYLSIYLILHLPVFFYMYFSCYNGPSITQALICFSFGPYHSQTLYYFSFVRLFVLWLNKFES